MNIIPGYAIKTIPSELGTLIALDRDRLEADVAEAIQQEESQVPGFDFQCEVVDNEIRVSKGIIRTPSGVPNTEYLIGEVAQTTLSEFLLEESGDVFVELSVTRDPIAASLEQFGTVTFVNEYNYGAGISNRSLFVFDSAIKKGVMPPSDSNYIRFRLAEYSVNSEGIVSLTQTHFGSITVQRPTQHNDFVVNFGIT